MLDCWPPENHMEFGQIQVVKKAYYLLTVQNPGIVAWYCGLKLETAVRLQQLITRMLQSDIVPDDG